MVLSIDIGWIVAGLLAATRWAGILMPSPVLGFSNLPATVRVLFLGMLSLITLVSLDAPPPALENLALTDLVVAVLRELLLGGAMGFGVQCAFGAFAVGGRLLDYQMGLSIATLFDPTTRAFNSLMGTLLSMMGATLFLTMDAHHSLIRATMLMFEVVPVGTPVDYRPDELIAQFGLMMAYGFALVTPAVAGLLLIDVAIALASRLMPQANAYFVAIPIKVFMGLLLFVLSLRFIEPLIATLFEEMLARWPQLVWLH